MSSDNQRWIALYTKPRYEKCIERELTRMDVEAYVPLRRELRNWSDRRKIVEAVLIPSYVFVRIRPCDYLRLLSVCGVVKAVMFNRRIACIRDSEIELLKRATQCKEYIEVTGNAFHERDEVEIIGGSFAGYRGRVSGTGCKCKVHIMIAELQCAVSVEVPVTYVRCLPIAEPVSSAVSI